MEKEIYNARITDTRLGYNDWNQLTFSIYTDSEYGACGFGGCKFGKRDDFAIDEIHFILLRLSHGLLLPFVSLVCVSRLFLSQPCDCIIARDVSHKWGFSVLEESKFKLSI